MSTAVPFFVHSEVAHRKVASDAVVHGRPAEAADRLPPVVSAQDGEAPTAIADAEGAQGTELRAVDEAGYDSTKPSSCCGGYRATPLLLAVITLMIIDAVFAVDSVTAKVSMVSQYDDRIDFFLNFTSTAFAMLCMPSLYFIIVLLVDIFRFLKYGLGGILILIGLKLLASEHIKVREDVSGLLLLSILGLSMLASLLVSSNKLETDRADQAPSQVHDDSFLNSEAAA